MVKKKNNKVFSFINAHSWSQQIMRSKKPGKIAMFFTLLESRGYCISGACAPQAHCQGFAVAYYSFTLDAVDLQHPRLLQR